MIYKEFVKVTINEPRPSGNGALIVVYWHECIVPFFKSKFSGKINLN